MTEPTTRKDAFTTDLLPASSAEEAVAIAAEAATGSSPRDATGTHGAAPATLTTAAGSATTTAGFGPGVFDPAGAAGMPSGTNTGATAARQPRLVIPIPASVSIFLRLALLFYWMLILYASWFPFSGWRSNGTAPFAYLDAPLPYYWTGFDVAVNILGYMPFGALLVFSLYPYLRRFAAFVCASAVGLLLSGTIEAVQNFLPSRVASNLDLITNSAGVTLGALAGVLVTRVFFEKGRLLLERRRWFTHEASRGLIVLGLWPLAQIYPQGYWLGHGQWLPLFSEWLSDLWSTPVDLSAMLLRGMEFSPEQYWLAEIIVSSCGLTGAVLTLFCVLRTRAPRLMLALLLVGAAVAARTLAGALLFAPENAFVWMTPGAIGGMLIGLLMLSGLAFAPPVAQRRVAGLALIVSLVVVNIAPTNPYFAATLQAWVQGKFLNFNGAAQFLSLLWPFFTLWFLYHPVHRARRG
jgi:VanZ family protein